MNRILTKHLNTAVGNAFESLLFFCSALTNFSLEPFSNSASNSGVAFKLALCFDTLRGGISSKRGRSLVNASSDTAAGDDELRLLNLSCVSDEARFVRRSSVRESNENFFEVSLRMPGSDLLCFGPLSTLLGERLCCTISMESVRACSVWTGVDAARVCIGSGRLLPLTGLAAVCPLLLLPVLLLRCTDTPWR